MQLKLYTKVFEEPEKIVARIRNGESELREAMLKNYTAYIASVVSRMINASAQGRDEFSVALEAFNDAIDSYDENRNAGFLTFCELVINRRVIDYIRRSKNYSREYPFTYFEVSGNDNIIDRIPEDNSSFFVNNLEIKEEILEFKNNLKDFNITLDDLVRLAPKHIDTKLLCISIAKYIKSAPKLSQRLERDGHLPVNELLEPFSVSRKTLDKHRKYIIALYIVLNSNMDIIKGYIDFMTDERKK